LTHFKFVLYFQTELSNLETYWNNCNIVSITEELNRHFNESNHSDRVLNHLTKEVADLYSNYTNAKQRQVVIKYF